MSTWLIDTALYTALLIALVLVLRRPVARHFGPSMAYALWALPLLRLVLPPLVLPASLAPAPEAAPVALDASTVALLLAAEQMNAAAVDVMEHREGQLTPRQLAEIRDIAHVAELADPSDPHGWALIGGYGVHRQFSLQA